MTPSDWQAISVMPTLSVTDLEAACTFYGRLGFEEQWRYPEAGDCTHIGVRFGEVSMMLWLCQDGATHRQNLYFIMKSLRAFHAHVREVLPDLDPIIEADYGMLDFSLTDPWGHLLTFGEASPVVEDPDQGGSGSTAG